jgi:transposase
MSIAHSFARGLNQDLATHPQVLTVGRLALYDLRARSISQSLDMHSNLKVTPCSSSSDYVAFIGLDCGDKSHAFSLWSEANPTPQSGELSSRPEILHPWLQEIVARFKGKPIALALEGHPGAVLHLLAQYPSLTIYPVNPATSARYRKAFVPSGAKDDVPDAAVLLDLVHHHRDKLRILQWEDENSRQLAGLVRGRRDAVNRRTQTGNQLTSLLKCYYPQALDLIGEKVHSPMALEFLARWPDLISLKAARPGTIRNFYYGQNLRRPELVEKRLEMIKNSVAVTTDSALVSVSVIEMKLLVEVLSAYNKHIQKYDEETKRVFAEHEDARLFKELPGAGKALAPRLAVAFGKDRSRFPDAASFQKLTGIAPVREKSGGRLWTHWRWQAPAFQRQTMVEWAGQTVLRCEWANYFYERMKARDKKHQTIMRSLAFRWARILWKCWQTKTPYDEKFYLESLKRAKSPNLPPEVKSEDKCLQAL